MKKILVLGFALAATGALGQVTTWPDGYWDRQYGFAQPWSVSYMVSLKVESPSAARDKAIKLIEQSGGHQAQNGMYGGFGRGGQTQQIAFTIPIEKADKAAKRLLTLGDIQQFSTQKMGMANQLPEIREKIAAIDNEQKANAAELARMPVAKALLASLSAKLAQSRDSYEAGVGSAMINLSLMDAHAPEGAAPEIRYKQAVPVGPANESAAKGALGALRSALSIYYGDTEGHYPAKLSDLTVGGKYLSKISKIRVASHAETDAVTIITGVKDAASLKAKLKDTGGWAYVADPKSPMFGTVIVDCTHSDSRGNQWPDY